MNHKTSAVSLHNHDKFQFDVNNVENINYYLINLNDSVKISHAT